MSDPGEIVQRRAAANTAISVGGAHRPLGRLVGSEIAQQIGVVRFTGRDGADEGIANLIRGTAELSRVTENMVKHAEADYIANYEIDQRRNAAEKSAKHRLDPESFRKEWDAHGEGTLNAVPAAFRGRAALTLKAVGSREYETIVNRTAADIEGKAKVSWAEAGEIKNQEFLTLVRAGKGDTPAGVAAIEAVAAHLDEGVKLKALDVESARIERDRIAASADAEAIKLRAVGAYQDEMKRPAPGTPPAKTGTSEEQDAANVAARIGEAGSRDFKPEGPRPRFRGAVGEDKAAVTPGTPAPGQLADSPTIRARRASDEVLKKLDTDPNIAPLLKRGVVSAEGIRRGVENEIQKIEAEAEAARRAALEGVDYQLWRVKSGYDADPDVLRRAAAAFGPGDTSRAAAITRTLLNKAGDVAAFRDMPVNEMAASIQETRTKLQDPKAPPSLRDELETKQALHEIADRDFKADPFFAGLRSGPGRKHTVERVDFASPNWEAALTARRRAADEISGFQRTSVVPLFADETATIMSRIRNAAFVDQVALIARLDRALGPYAPTFWKQTAKGEGETAKTSEAVRMSALAGIALKDRVLAREVAEGWAVLKTEKKQQLVKDDEMDRVVNDLVGSVFQHAPQARAAIVEMTYGLAAQYASRNGKLGTELNYETVKSLAQRVVGNVVTHNGSKILPPRRDMWQFQFDEILSRIRDQDMPPIRALDGSEAGIVKHLRAGNLENIGDGRYVLRVGSGYALDPANRRKWLVLDRAFFERVEMRQQYEDFGDFTAGEPVRRISGRGHVRNPTFEPDPHRRVRLPPGPVDAGKE